MAVQDEKEVEKLVGDITIRAYRNVRAKLDEEAETMAEKILGLCCDCGRVPGDLRKKVIKILKLEDE